MVEDLLRRFKISSYQECRPINAMKLGDVFSDNMYESISFWCLLRITCYSEVIDQCIEPYVYSLCFIPRYRYAPVDPFTGSTHRYLGLPGFELLQHLVPDTLRHHGSLFLRP
jgi:hypothetical protein